jgi:stage V sporulation protein T
MKATGIIRRVDDLGRVIIPKEIRKTLRIQEGDPMELFISEEGITFKKYDYTANISSIITDLKNVVNDEYDIKNKSAICQKIKELEDIIKTEKENI